MTIADSLDPTTVALVLGFGTLALALTRKHPIRGLYVFFSGILWLCFSLTVFTIYGSEWVIITVGFGLLVLLEGSLELLEVIT